MNFGTIDKGENLLNDIKELNMSDKEQKNICDINWRDIKTDDTWRDYENLKCLIKTQEGDILFANTSDWIYTNDQFVYQAGLLENEDEYDPCEFPIKSYAIFNKKEELEKLKIKKQPIKKCKFSLDNPPIGYVFKQKGKGVIYYPLTVVGSGIYFILNANYYISWVDLMNDWEYSHSGKVWFNCYTNEEDNA